MIQINTNMVEVASKLQGKLSAIDVDKMTRLQAATLMAQMRNRIHVEGLASDGMPIGSYSKGYLKYTRPKYGRMEGAKVVLSLTRTMENSMILFPIANGTAIGYSTAEQLQKARWQEKRPAYGSREIFSPTEEERNLVIEIGKNYIKKHLQGNE